MSLVGGLMAGIGAVGSLGSAAIGANAAENAASTQAKAAGEAATLQTQLGQEGLNLQTEELNNAMTMGYPFVSSGYGAEANLDYLLGIPNASEFSPTAPQYSTPGIPGIAPGVGGGGVPMSSMTQAGPPLGVGGAGYPLVKGTAMAPTGTPTSGVPGTNGMVPLSSLVNPNLGQYGSLSTPWTQQFQAPTNVTEQNDPGYQFRFKQGLTALQNSAAASGNLLSGQTLKDINDYAQGYASNEYGNVYNRALGQFQQSYNIFENNQANMFNRLLGLKTGGQTAASQLNSAAQGGVNNATSILQGTGQAVSGDIQNQAAATASGYVGAANAWGGGLSGLTGGVNNMLMLQALQNQGFFNGPTYGPPNYSGLSPTGYQSLDATMVGLQPQEIG